MSVVRVVVFVWNGSSRPELMTRHRGDEPEYVTILDAARIYGFSVRTITRWVEQGRIPSILRSGETLVARGDLDAIVLQTCAGEEGDSGETES